MRTKSGESELWDSLRARGARAFGWVREVGREEDFLARDAAGRRVAMRQK